jgi:ISXO2-like transposase domain
MTDEAAYYRSIGRRFRYHFAVEHGIGEYVHGGAQTNTAISASSSAMTGVPQHCSSRHLKRYLAEFDFGYNERVALGVGDPMRLETALMSIFGRRLTYRGSSAPAADE